jgi:hypothetical protein
VENETEDNSGIQDYGPEVEAAREWLDIGDEENDEPTTSNSKDILWIIKNCLKEVKKLKTGRTIKVMTQLTAVAEYVKLRTRYQAHPKCRKPHINASLAIAF